jgi:16S rRNA (cytosine1402-N4)-methyltransferase
MRTFLIFKTDKWIVVENFHHITVLAEELVAALALRPGDIAIDCTAGGGGHTERMLAAVGPRGKVLAIDRDQDAIANLKKKFAAPLHAGSLLLHHGAFSQLDSIVRAHGLQGKIRGIGADFGVSSHQLDRKERGFSLQQDGPLDMRMSPESGGITAEEVIADSSQEDLADIIYQYGEEPKSRYFAKILVTAREKERFVSTLQLANFLQKHSPYPGHSRKHPATKIFQALRIFVNDELGEIPRLLAQAFAALQSGGRLATITFHSLEDRLTKQFCQEKAGKAKIPAQFRDLPLAVLPGAEKHATIIRPFPGVPSDDEIARNSRARSAKLRVLEKL